MLQTHWKHSYNTRTNQPLTKYQSYRKTFILLTIHLKQIKLRINPCIHYQDQLRQCNFQYFQSLKFKWHYTSYKSTWLRGNNSASIFLYLFTGCLDLGRIEGHKKQRLPQTGTIRLDITPIFSIDAQAPPMQFT